MKIYIYPTNHNANNISLLNLFFYLANKKKRKRNRNIQ